MQNNLSPGFTPLDEAIELIKSDTRETPVVDIKYALSRIIYIETGKNFRIPRIRRLSMAEYEEREAKRKEQHRYSPTQEIEEVGEINVYISSNYEKELLRQVLRDKYKEEVGHDYQEAITHSKSTVADDAQGVPAVRPRKIKSNTTAGTVIGESSTLTSNGEGLNV